MKCQAPKSRPAATTLTSTSAGPTSGRATSQKSSTSADPYLSCTIAFIRPHLIAIRPTAPATVVLGPGPRQSRRSAEEPGPGHRAPSRRPSTLHVRMVLAQHAAAVGEAVVLELAGLLVLAPGSQGEAERPGCLLRTSIMASGVGAGSCSLTCLVE